MVAPFISQNIGENQKKKFLPTNQWVFGLKTKKKTTKWCHPKMVTTMAGRSP